MTETGETKQRKSDKISALAQLAQGCQRRAATEKNSSATAGTNLRAKAAHERSENERRPGRLGAGIASLRVGSGCCIRVGVTSTPAGPQGRQAEAGRVRDAAALDDASRRDTHKHSTQHTHTPW